MKFRLQVIRTSSDGAIVATQDVSAEVFRKVSFEETVGDESVTKASDLNIETNEALTILEGSGTNWLVLYCDEIFFNVYKHPTALEEDEKFGHFKYRCYSLQKVFYDHLGSTAIELDDAHPSWWNYELPNSYVTITAVSITQEGPVTELGNDVAGFPIGSMLDALAGQDNGYGYFIDEVNHVDIPIPNEDDLPILFRGTSAAVGVASDETIINTTFKESTGGDLFNMTWLDIFKFVIFGWNAFIKIDPHIRWSDTLGLYVLGINIHVKPKISVIPASQIEEHKMTWLERKIVSEKYKIDGVSINGKNFEFEQGNVDAGNVFSRSIDIADYDVEVADALITMYWAAASYNSGSGEYEIDSPWFFSPFEFVQGYYADMITDGHGITGKCKLIYSGANVAPTVLRTLDQVKVGNRTAQIVNIRCDESGIASVEGILLD